MTLAEAQTRLNAALTRYDNAASAQSMRYGDKSVSNYELQDLLSQVEYWERRVRRLEDEAAGVTSPGERIATWS